MSSPSSKELQQAHLDCHTKGKNQPTFNGETGEVLERPKWRTNYNHAEFFKEEPSPNELPSMTIPGQDMSISDMMERYNNGMSVPVSNMEVLDNEDEPFPQFEDILDIQEAQEHIKNVNERLEKARKAKQKKGEPSQDASPSVVKEATKKPDSEIKESETN